MPTELCINDSQEILPVADAFDNSKTIIIITRLVILINIRDHLFHHISFSKFLQCCEL